MAKRQLTQVNRGTVSENVATRYHIARLHDWPLVDTSVLVRALVLGEVVDIDRRVVNANFFRVDADHDAARIDRIDHTPSGRDLADTRIGCDVTLHAGAHKRLLGFQGRYCLPLHVGAHQCAVRIIVLEERDQRCRNRHHLLRRYVHELHVRRRLHSELIHVADVDQVFDEPILCIQRRRCLSNHILRFINGRQVLNVVSHHTVNHLAVRRLQKAVFVGARVGRERIDQANVRAFRGLDRANPAIVGRMHITDLEAGPLTGQTARAEGRNATLVRDLGKRIILVHELRQLAGTEKLFHRSRDWLGVDQVLRHQPFTLRHGESLFDGALNAHQTNAELVLGHLTHRADASISEVVNIVYDTLAVADIHQGTNDIDNVFFVQRRRTGLVLATQAAVKLHPPNGRQIIALG